MCSAEFLRSSLGIGAYVTLVVFASVLTLIFFPLEGVPAQTRVYYIAAEEGMWNYTQYLEGDAIESLPEAARPYLSPGPSRIGGVYMKARYVQYTSPSFDEKVQQGRSLGILGPTIYAQVGDVVKVYFRNNLRYPTNLRPHGLQANARPDAPFDTYLVDPGITHVYTWQVTEEAGPQGIYDGAVAWLYYPDLTSGPNWHSGLVGMVVVTTLDSASLPIDISSSYPLLFAVFDENLSPYIELSGERALGVEWLQVNRSDPAFIESNRIACINGFAVSVLAPLDVKRKGTTQLYLGTLSTGTPQEKMVVHLHGHDLYHLGHRRTAVKLTPGSVHVTELVHPEASGQWLIRSTSTELTNRGVSAYYVVQ